MQNQMHSATARLRIQSGFADPKLPLNRAALAVRNTSQVMI